MYRNTRSLALGLCIVGSGAIFQEAQPTATQEFVLAPGKHEVRDLIENVAKFLKRNYLYTDSDLNHSPTIDLQQEIRVDERGCDSVFSALLYAKGLAVITHDEGRGLYEVINMAGPKRNQINSSAKWMTPDDVIANRQTYKTVLTSVPLQFVNANTATTSLRPFFQSANTPGGGLIPGNVGNGRAILLQGFAPSVAAAIQLLREVDVAPREQGPSVKGRVSALEARVKALEAKLSIR